MSLLGELLGPCTVGPYLFGWVFWFGLVFWLCFFFFFLFPLPSLCLPCAEGGGTTVGLAGSLFPSLSGENSGKGERLRAHGCVVGARAPLELPTRGSAAASTADRAAGERVSMVGIPAPAPVSRTLPPGLGYLSIAPRAALGSG